jgi:hypothetical protein
MAEGHARRRDSTGDRRSQTRADVSMLELLQGKAFKTVSEPLISRRLR